MPPKPFTDEQIEERKQAILDAALDIWRTQGPAALSVRNIAEAIGYSSMTLYVFYKDKQAIIRAMTAHVVQGLIAKIHGVEDIRELVAVCLRWCRDNPEDAALVRGAVLLGDAETLLSTTDGVVAPLVAPLVVAFTRNLTGFSDSRIRIILNMMFGPALLKDDYEDILKEAVVRVYDMP